MAQATKRPASSNRRSGGNSRSRAASTARKNSSSSARKNSSSRSNGNAARAKSSSNAARSRSSSARSRSTSNKRSTSNSARSNGRGPVARIGSATKDVAVPVATAVAGAAAGVVGGVVFQRRSRKPRKVLGIPIPGSRKGLNGVAKEVGKAGKQLGTLANEIRTTREKAEDVGKALK